MALGGASEPRRRRGCRGSGAQGARQAARTIEHRSLVARAGAFADGADGEFFRYHSFGASRARAASQPLKANLKNWVRFARIQLLTDFCRLMQSSQVVWKLCLRSQADQISL